MSRVKLDKDKILKKFQSLSMTALCIQKTSKYMYQFFKSSDSIVSIWYQALLSASDQSKIALFYIANEMLQSRNYGSTNFKQSWKPHLQRSVQLLKNSSTIDKIIRMFNIWIERRVFDQPFVEELISKLSSTRSPVVNEEETKNIILNFEPEDAMDKLKNLMKIESEVNETMKRVESSALNFDEKSCREAIKKLKDKAQCNEFSNQLDGTINQLFQICSLMEEELKVRKKTLKTMEHAEIYYQTQLSETLIVEDAYKRYGNLISKTKEVLEEHMDFVIDDSTGPVDIDDAPSPGKTPPYLYDGTVKHASNIRNSPMSFQDVVSPAQSMDMSEDDTPMDASSYNDKPYSPSHDVDTKCDTQIPTVGDESKPSLSCSDALKILTSVFTQSLTKKVSTEPEVRLHLQPDMFRNTLSTASINNETIETNNNNSNGSDNSDSVVADAFRLISNLTGIKNISERNYKTETTTSGTTIPILTSKNSYRNISNDVDNKLKSNMFPYNQPTYPSVNISTKCDTMPHTMFTDVQNSFPPNMFNPHSVSNNQIFPLLSNHSGLTSQPPPPLFNPISNNLTFNIGVINKDNTQSARKSPGSCTEDEDDGSATPTQDEPIIHQNPTNIFNQNVIPVLQSAEDINKQIQNAINVSTNPFGLTNMLPGTNESNNNNSIQQSQWNINNQFQFNLNNSALQPPLNMPFNLINQPNSIQPSFSPLNNSKSNLSYGPPRAIRTKRPNTEACLNQAGSNNEIFNLPGSMDFNLTPPPPPPPKPDGDTLNVIQQDDQPKLNPPDNDSKLHDKESELLNLYGDVEEELERNYNFNQQNINVRSSRPPPPSDRYHLYNQGSSQNTNYRFNDNHNGNNTNSSSNSNNWMNYQHPYSYRNQLSRGGAMHFPNRTTNFRPRQNYNMFN